MANSSNIDFHTNQALQDLVDQAVTASEAGIFSKATECYKKAIEGLPEPKKKQRIFPSLVGALAESLTHEKKYQEVLKTVGLLDYKVDGPISDMPLLHFYWGKALYESGNLKDSAQQLSIAFMSEFLQSGQCLYTSTQLASEDPKYFALVQKTIPAPEEWGLWDVATQPPSFLQKVWRWFAN